MKVAPLVSEMEKWPDKFKQILVHTGQHYDQRMSCVFFEQLGLPRPDVNLEVGSGSHAVQTGRIMAAFEGVCLKIKPDLVVVVGDVNSTMACAITAKKLGISVAHVEAGLRSRDMFMPEEINRLCTDAISDLLFTTDKGASENLLKEGIEPGKIHFVGNVMIDTLNRFRQQAGQLEFLKELGLENGKYATATLHRPSNVDEKTTFGEILRALHQVSQYLPIIFPIHPRTRKQAYEFGLAHLFTQSRPVRGLWITEPLGYLEFLHLNMNARLVLTDSGGLQEETTVLGVPCLTLRHSTERPITCSQGSNRLVGNDGVKIVSAVHKILGMPAAKKRVPEKWDGKAASRIVSVLKGLPIDDLHGTTCDNHRARASS